MDWLQGSVLNEEEQRRVDAYWVGREAHEARQAREEALAQAETTQEHLDAHRNVIVNMEESLTKELLDARSEITWREAELNFFTEYRKGNCKKQKWQKLQEESSLLAFDRESIEEELEERLKDD